MGGSLVNFSRLPEFDSSFRRLHHPLFTLPARASLRFAFLFQQKESKKGPHSLPGALKGWQKFFSEEQMGIDLELRSRFYHVESRCQVFEVATSLDQGLINPFTLNPGKAAWGRGGSIRSKECRAPFNLWELDTTQELEQIMNSRPGPFEGHATNAAQVCLFLVLLSPCLGELTTFSLLQFLFAQLESGVY